MVLLPCCGTEGQSKTLWVMVFCVSSLITDYNLMFKLALGV